MKIFILTLFFTLVMLLDSVQSIQPSPPRLRPRPAQGGPPRVELRRYDVIVRGGNYAAQFVQDVYFFFKITSPGRFVYAEGKPVSMHPSELRSGDLLIRFNRKWAVFRLGWFFELPEDQRVPWIAVTH